MSSSDSMTTRGQYLTSVPQIQDTSRIFDGKFWFYKAPKGGKVGLKWQLSNQSNQLRPGWHTPFTTTIAPTPYCFIPINLCSPFTQTTLRTNWCFAVEKQQIL